jgi:hypothetical protein
MPLFLDTVLIQEVIATFVIAFCVFFSISEQLFGKSDKFLVHLKATFYKLF